MLEFVRYTNFVKIIIIIIIVHCTHIPSFIKIVVAGVGSVLEPRGPPLATPVHATKPDS